MIEFVTENWAILIVAFLAFLKVIVNLTPSEKDNAVFGILDTIITAIVGNKIKSKPEKKAKK